MASVAAKPQKTPKLSDRARKSNKPAPPVEDVLKRHFKSLVSQIDGGHFKNAIKTTNKILRLSPSDKDAIQAKLFLLLQTEDYKEAMALIESQSSPEVPSHQYEKSYCLYRLNKESEAESILKQLQENVDVDQRGVMHLEAQISYRKEQFSNAVELYTQLLDSTPSGTEEYNDTTTNLNAAQAYVDFLSTGFQKHIHKIPIDELETSAPPTVASTSTAGVVPSTGGAKPPTSAQPTTDPAQTKKKTRLRRVPKGITPGVTPAPDPERWIKKSERTSYQSGYGKKRRGAAGYGAGATQGVSLERETSVTGSISGGGGGGGKQSGGGGKGKKKR